LDSLAFDLSSKGIVAQVLSGAAPRFLRFLYRIVNEVRSLDLLRFGISASLIFPMSRPQYPDFDNAVGHAYVGAFYVLAPWPMASLSSAERCMATLNSHAPRNRRNRYYQAVVAFRQEKWALVSECCCFLGRL
jgi:hypothetical protein